jgi:hypothetical protein
VSDEGTFIDPEEIVAEAERLTKVGLARELHQMNQRIDRRREEAALGRFVPIDGPRWADKVVDTGRELLAIHKNTAEPYPLEYEDLTPEDHAVVVLQRLIVAGTSQVELERVLRSLVLPHGVVARLLFELRDGR